jgi:hypothetical protein
MKKLSVLFLSLVALSLSVVSCSSDDDKDEAASIEGKWELFQEGETLQTLEKITDENDCTPTVVEILKGGKYIGSGSEYYDSKCNTYTFKGDWSRNGNMLSMQDEGDDEVNKSEIIELTSSTLKLKEVDEEGTWYIVLKRK